MDRGNLKKMKAKNIKEAKELVDRYESITLEEIKEEWSPFLRETAEILTGFGNMGSCSLCRKVSGTCMNCIYHPSDCVEGENEETYDRILEARSPTKLRNAFRARAKHIRKIIGYEKV